MQKHLYNSRLGKVSWFIKRFGASEIFLKPLRVTLAPLILPRLPQKQFEFRGRKLACVYHAYNMTWACERSVEIPIGRSFIEGCAEGSSVLEVGNVLSHYGPIKHEVLDKFEKGPGIINEDIVTFAPQRSYDLILSISTFEHIGFDDSSLEPSGKKIQEALYQCRRLLKTDGTFAITVPIGYNPDLDELIRSNALGELRQTFLKRAARLEWSAVNRQEALSCRYRSPFPYANAILIAEFGPAR